MKKEHGPMDEFFEAPNFGLYNFETSAKNDGGMIFGTVKEMVLKVQHLH